MRFETEDAWEICDKLVYDYGSAVVPMEAFGNIDVQSGGIPHSSMVPNDLHTIESAVIAALQKGRQVAVLEIRGEPQVVSLEEWAVKRGFDTVRNPVWSKVRRPKGGSTHGRSQEKGRDLLVITRRPVADTACALP